MSGTEKGKEHNDASALGNDASALGSGVCKANGGQRAPFTAL